MEKYSKEEREKFKALVKEYLDKEMKFAGFKLYDVIVNQDLIVIIYEREQSSPRPRKSITKVESSYHY